MTKLTDKEQKAYCDLVVSRAAELMEVDVDAPVQMIVDRLLTYVAAQIVVRCGRDEASNMLRFAAGRIDSGAFDCLVPELNTIN